MSTSTNTDRSIKNKKTETNQKTFNWEEKSIMTNNDKINFSSSSNLRNTFNICEEDKSLQKSMSQSFKFSDIIGLKYHERYQKSIVDHQNNLKILQDIQERALKLRQKQKNERESLKKLKKLYLKKLQQLKQGESLTKQMMQQKERQIQFLNIQNQELRDKKAQFVTAIQQNNSIRQINQQLSKDNQRLSKDLHSMKEQYKTIKVKYDEQLELMDQGIRSQRIQQDLPNLNNTLSLKDLDQLSRALSQNKSQVQKKFQQLAISLQKLDKTEKIVKEKQFQIVNLNLTIKQLEQTIKNNQQQAMIKFFLELKQMENLKKESQQPKDLSKLVQQRQKQIKQNNMRIIKSFQSKMLDTLDRLKINQYSAIYDIFVNLTKQFFASYYENRQTLFLSQSDQMIWLGLIQQSLAKLDEYLNMKAKNDIQRTQKVIQYMKNANIVLNRIGDEQTTPQKIFSVSSLQKMGLNIEPSSLKKYQLENSQNSQSPQKKSILLQEDLINAISQNDKIIQGNKYSAKQQAQINLKYSMLQEQTDRIKQNPPTSSQVKPGSTKSKDNGSQQSFSKSMKSSTSQAEKNANYLSIVRKGKLNAKLKKNK